MPGKTAVVLFTRDLRVTDNPALWAARGRSGRCRCSSSTTRSSGSRFAAPNRVAYMREALIDLDGRLKAMDGRLFLRRGQVVEEAMRWRASAAPRSSTSPPTGAPTRGGASGGCGRRARRRGSSSTAHPGVTILEPGAVTPTGGDHFKVFSPYHRAWSEAPWREGARRAAQAERAVGPRRGRAAGARRS